MKAKVEIREVHSRFVTVEYHTGATIEEIAAIANQKLEEGEVPEELYYRYTLDPDKWIITTG
jgi:hypothetical protein